MEGGADDDEEDDEDEDEDDASGHVRMAYHRASIRARIHTYRHTLTFFRTQTYADEDRVGFRRTNSYILNGISVQPLQRPTGLLMIGLLSQGYAHNPALVMISDSRDKDGFAHYIILTATYSLPPACGNQKSCLMTPNHTALRTIHFCYLHRASAAAESSSVPFSFPE